MVGDFESLFVGSILGYTDRFVGKSVCAVYVIMTVHERSKMCALSNVVFFHGCFCSLLFLLSFSTAFILHMRIRMRSKPGVWVHSFSRNTICWVGIEARLLHEIIPHSPL